MNVERISAFSYNKTGGNPAGVQFNDSMLSNEEMLTIAKEVNYSETAFLVKEKDAFRIRYFSPQTEIPFCGHATVASGYLIGQQYGMGEYELILNDGLITIEVTQNNDEIFTSITSMSTDSKLVDNKVIDDFISLFNFDKTDLDERFPVQVAFSGNNHLILFVKEKRFLQNMEYNFEKAKVLMHEHEIVTISILYCENENVYHSRNAFAYGGVYEDPATGSAAVALAEYLRDIGFKKEGQIEILQGFDMQQPSQLFASYENEKKSPIKVWGTSRTIKDNK